MFRPLRSTRARRAALAVCLAAITGTQAMPAEPVASMDLARYSGRWYVIAQAPGPSTPTVGAFFEFTAQPNGQISEIYSAREGAFDHAAVAHERVLKADPQQPGRWTARRNWFSTEQEWVLFVSSDYRVAVAAVPDRDVSWILAREPVIPEWTYAGLLARAALQGYDVSRFRRVPQKPEQLGQPGYE
jgi:apolipoprotein D and lipocalin family protein